MEEKGEIERQVSMREDTDKRAHHILWLGSNLETKRACIGLRIGTNNFQRKLYASKENIIETIKQCENLKLDILLGTEPGQGTLFNRIRIKNTMREHGYGVITTTRDSTTIGGGLALILGPRWAKIPHTKSVYTPNKREHRGRAMSIIFNNQIKGAHNKIQIIAVHALNAAETNEEATSALITWVGGEKEAFEAQNPLATTILLGDLNAAINTFLDTDRQVREQREEDTEEQEKDAFVIKEIEKLKLVDIFRGRFPTTRATTRVSKDQTNRFLDKIMATSEVAAHPDTEVAIYKEQFLMAGSDHKMIVADLPIDTAGIADERVAIWEPRTVTKWVRDTDDMGRISSEKVKAFNTALESTECTGPGSKEYTDWVMKAARGTILKKTVKIYPKKASLKELYTPDDHKTRANLRAMRYLEERITNKEDCKQTAVIAKRRLTVVKDTELTKKVIDRIIKTVKKNTNNNPITELEDQIQKAEMNLSKKNRLSRATKIRKAVKLRSDRFKDDGKLMLKMVINSLMRRYKDNEEITAVTNGNDMEYGEEEVKKVVKEFYEEWMASRVGVKERFDSWEDMLDIKPNKLKFSKHRRIVTEAYQESKNKYDLMQKEGGIWNGIRKSTDLEETKRAIKSHVRAPGPSGLTYDIMSKMEDHHLSPLVDIINKTLETGRVEQEVNKALMRPLPKTDKGLAELAKTRPIALMETILKITEKIIFDRITKVLNGQGMLRKEQHGNKSVKAPIRSLTEMIEDAIQTGSELHIFSADIAKAFDSIEYWSQAISWSALGMPPDLVNMLVDMDKEGQTSVILGQGRSTDWYKSGRGVRQGSIGGPIKWAVFINFWLELVHKAAKGEGYRMAEAAPEDEETLGHMYVDDSNWMAGKVEGMNLLIELGEEFTEFHGLKFNKAKCEYLAINQQKDKNGEYELPIWGNGDRIDPKMRHAVVTAQEKEARHKANIEVRNLAEAALLEEEGAPANNPTNEEHERIDQAINGWKEAVYEGDPEEVASRRNQTIRLINEQKLKIYQQGDEQCMRETTTEWAGDMDKALAIVRGHRGGKGKATRYLGVMFELSPGWNTQKKVLESKFKDLNTRINSSKPNREQAVYCVNAVINAAIKYPLQVAHIPNTTLRRWDSANREVVRRAGCIPKLASGLSHIQKEHGGMGLHSLEAEVERSRVTDQMIWLNSNSMTGQIVRAAQRRWKKNAIREKGTIQAHTMKAIEQLGAKIVEEEESTIDIRGEVNTKINYKGKERQAIRDTRTAQANEEEGDTVHSFGDGATWDTENKSGWGVAIINNQGNQRTKNGRVPGKQTNDAAETRAILQGLLETHPLDPLIIYCDNQGCVDNWHKPTGKHKIEGLARNNRAMWNRIQSLRDLRQELGTETKIEWVHSHVDNEERRDRGGKGKYQCACGGTKKPGKKGCTEPDEEGHWIHEGNEEADQQAGEGADNPEPDPGQVRAGEHPYILVNAERETDSAQGSYKAWVEQRQWQRDGTRPSKTRERIEAVRERADEKATSTVVKALGQKGSPSWRFWSRTLLQCLPTHSQMAKFAGSSTENIYKQVYQDSIGTEGQCIRCGCPKETTLHALYECEGGRDRWERTLHKIEELWRQEEEEWDQVDWLTEAKAKKWYPNWTQDLSIVGMIPKGALQRMRTKGPPAIKLINKTANMILNTAQGAWEQRIETTQDWLDSNPELKERKKRADRIGWKSDPKKREPPTREKKDKEEHMGQRYKRIKIEALQKASEVKKRKEVMVEGKIQREMKYCGDNQIMAAHPAARERHAKELLKKACRDSETEARSTIKRAKIAQGTRDIKEEELEVVSMEDSQPAISTEKRDHHWVPRIGMWVKALWTEKEGTKVGNLKGKWWKGKVIALDWPENKGVPGATVRYPDGHEEWHGIDTCGITVKPQKRPRQTKEVPYTAAFPKAVEKWLGIGSRVKVRWRGAGWLKGEVIGEDRHGTIVRYGDNSVVAHDDLTTRGCKVLEFRKHRNPDQYYQERPWLKCPYSGEEEDCECWPCQERERWARETEDMSVEQREQVMRLPTWQRAAEIQNALRQPKKRIPTATPSKNPNSSPNQETQRQPVPRIPTAAQIKSPNGSPNQKSQRQPKLKIPTTSQIRNGGHSPADDEQTRGRGGDRASPESDNAHQERQDEDPEVAHQQGDQLKRKQKRDRETARGQDLGLGGQECRPRRACAQKQGGVETAVARHGRETDSGGKSRCCMGRRGGSKHTREQGRSQRGGLDLDNGKRRATENRTVEAPPTETQADAGSKESYGKTKRRPEGDICGTDDPDSGGESEPHKSPEQTKQQGPVDELDSGLNQVDDPGEMDPGGSNSNKDDSGSEHAKPGTTSRPEVPGNRCGRRMGEREEGPTGPPGSGGGRNRQAGTHKHRNETRCDHSSGRPRPDNEGKGGPVHDTSKEGGEGNTELGTAMDVPGMLTNVNCERNKSGNGISSRKVGKLSTEQRASVRRKNGPGGGVPAGVSSGPGKRGRSPGSAPEPELRPGEPSNFTDVGGRGDQGGHEEEPRMETRPGRPVRVRQTVPETDLYPDEPKELGPEGPDKQREVQARAVRGNKGQRSGEQTTQRTNSAKLQREETKPGTAHREEVRVRQRSSGQRSSGAAGDRDHEGGNHGKRLREEEEYTAEIAEGPPCGPPQNAPPSPPQKKKPSNRHRQATRSTDKKKEKEKEIPLDKTQAFAPEKTVLFDPGD
jgi:ribonuclease HI